MINLLIAMISRRYEQVAKNSDVVWKFSRARLIREFALYPRTFTGQIQVTAWQCKV